MTEEIKQRIEQIRRGQVPVGYTVGKEKVLHPIDWKILKIGEWLHLKERPVQLRDDQYYKLVTVRRGFGGVDSRGYYQGKSILVKNYFKVAEGDFLISKRQIVHGACGIVPHSLNGAVVSNEYNIFETTEGTSIAMFNMVMRLPRYKRLFYLMSDGVHIEKMLFKTHDWLKQELSMPNTAEQQKIAGILTTQDRVIELKEKLLKEKQQQKKYLMQQLLTGKKRLPGFTDEWKIENLGSCAEMSSGGTPNSGIKEYYGDGYVWVSIKDMSDNGKYLMSSERHITEQGFQNCSAKLFPKGTILFAMYASIGECSIAGVECCTSQAILGIRPNSKLSPEFLYYTLCHYKSQFKKMGQESSQPNLNKGIVQSIRLHLPMIKEQNAISNVLSTADREIELLQQEIEAEKQKKKALMQLLLTGIVRVKT